MEEEGKSPSSRLRICYAVLQVVALVFVVRTCWVSGQFEQIFEQLGMRDLPAPSLAFVAAARGVRTPLGMIFVAILAAVLVVLGLKGSFDQRLRTLMAGNIIGVIFLAAFAYLSLFMPIIKIQQALSNR